jgi:hypothetical protein
LSILTSSDPELGEDALHGNLQRIVVGIDRFGVVRAAGWVEGPGGGEERFDSFVAENDEGGDRPETAGERFVAAVWPMRQKMCLPRGFFRS